MISYYFEDFLHYQQAVLKSIESIMSKFYSYLFVFKWVLDWGKNSLNIYLINVLFSCYYSFFWELNILTYIYIYIRNSHSQETINQNNNIIWHANKWGQGNFLLFDCPLSNPSETLSHWTPMANCWLHLSGHL